MHAEGPGRWAVSVTRQAVSSQTLGWRRQVLGPELDGGLCLDDPTILDEEGGREGGRRGEKGRVYGEAVGSPEHFEEDKRRSRQAPRSEEHTSELQSR